jgi:hypothetical protein
MPHNIRINTRLTSEHPGVASVLMSRDPGVENGSP